MAVAIARPKLEGNIAVGDDRQIGFAEFGDPQGRAIFWLHGTPGARRQIPMEARVYAEQRADPADRYRPARHRVVDAVSVRHRLRVRRGSAHHRRHAGHRQVRRHRAVRRRPLHAGVRGGHARPGGGGRCARRRRSDAAVRTRSAAGCRRSLTVAAPVIEVAGAPIRLAASGLIRLIRPVAEPALYVYARISPEADRRLLVRPEFKAMFLDDLLNGSRKQLAAPFADVVRAGTGAVRCRFRPARRKDLSGATRPAARHRRRGSTAPGPHRS